MGNTARTQTRANETSVHPHARGEYENRKAEARRPGRFTPTCMGNTFDHCVADVIQSVHPHVHGEYTTLPSTAGKVLGSPPHAWGILPSGRRYVQGHRFTPAHAGNTRAFVVGQNGAIGSPPRAWGIHRCAAFCVRQGRFTPTRAGNTSFPTRPFLAKPVHPRARGEYHYQGGRRDGQTGSPPRTRGIPPLRGERDFGDAVHPRARGEYKFIAVNRCGSSGSPPRTRGIPFETSALSLVKDPEVSRPSTTTPLLCQEPGATLCTYW